jgi:O-antigen ligase
MAAFTAATPLLPLLGVGSVILLCSLLAFYLPDLQRSRLNFCVGWLLIIAASYAAASAVGVLDRSWTTMFSNAAIIRQAHFVLLLAVVLVSSIVVWSKVRDSYARGTFVLIMLLSASVVAVVLTNVQRLGEGKAILLIPGLTNPSLIGIGSGLMLGASSARAYRWVAIAVGLSLLVLTENAQMLLCGAFIILSSVASYRTLRSVALLAIAVAITLVALVAMDPLGVVRAAGVTDPNSVIRSLFWSDVYRASRETYYVGVGFGTEAVRNYYPVLDDVRPYEDEQLVGQGVHNLFLNVIFRMGLPGLVTLSWIYYLCFPLRSAEEVRGRVALCSFVLAFVSSNVNVAESPTTLVGVSMLLALSAVFGGRVGARPVLR